MSTPNVRISILGVLMSISVLICSASEIRDGKPRFSTFPSYPEQARLAHAAGTVRVWFALDDKGSVTDAGVISGNSMLRNEALNVVKTWRFDRGQLPSNVRLETEFVFVLGTQSVKSVPKLTVSITDFRRVEISSEIYVKTVE